MSVSVSVRGAARGRYSIRRRLVLLLSLSVALVWAGMLAWSYTETREEVNEQADERLEEGARTIMLLDLQRLTALVSDAERRADDDDDDDDAHLRFQVWGRDGTLRLRSPGAPEVQYRDDSGHKMLERRGYRWHTYAMVDPLLGYQVRVFEKPGVRGKLVNKTALRMAGVLLVGLPALALLAWISVGYGLRPLRTLSGAIAQRDANKLEPITLDQVPSEAQPLIDSLNRLLLRLSASIEHERAFTADAAHELRTPLAAIKIQAEVALGARDDGQRNHAMGQIIAGVNRTTHLVRQLLLLARLDQPALQDAVPVDLHQVVADSAARYAGDALDKGIDFELEAEAECMLQADPVALAALADNLIDNAIKYGEREGRVQVRVWRTGATVTLAVLGDGPAPDAATLGRLTDRFYRAGGNSAEGSGLGLSIVDKIARAYRGSLQLGTGRDGAGFGATVVFRL